MQKVFITSDIHFNHKNIIKYCNRPYENVEEMNADIIKKWNSVVSKDDTVWILGDLCFGSRAKTKELIEQLNGRKRLIMGNHDSFNIQTYRDMGFEFVSPYPIIYKEKYILSHVPMDVPEGYINIFGHIHNSPVFPPVCKDGICVCLDRFTSFTPVELQKLIEMQIYETDENSKPLSYYIHLPEAAEIMKVEK